MASKFVIDPVKKNLLTKLVDSGKNVLLTGGTGCGKTTLAIELANELGLNPIVVNCGSTQDARSSLLGYFTLKNGDTVFQEADFLKAIQEENTLLILDELSRASDDAYNILFPILDFRQEVRVDEKDDNRIVKIANNVKFLATANIGIEYSSARSIDRALQDRFLTFNIPYLKGSQVKTYVKKQFDSETSDKASSLFKIYDYSHKLYQDAKLSARLSTRMILDVMPLVNKFTTGEILDHVILSIFKQDSSTIINDANVLREYADSLGVYKKADSAKN